MEITSYLLGKKNGGTQPTGEVNITINGITNVSGYATANVQVQPDLQDKSISITSNGSSSVSCDENYDGLGTVSITTNVQPDLESKSITITSNTETTITPTSGKDGLSSVVVTTNVSGGSGPDWTAIGYEDETPQSIIDGYNYAKNIYDNWDSSITSAYQMYKNDKKLVFFPSVDMSNITNYKEMFSGSNLIELDYFNTYSGGNMIVGSNLCYNCISLKRANIKTSNTGYGMQSDMMFSGCSALETVNIEGKIYSNLASMFRNCTNLKNINILTFSFITRASALQNMFQYCPSLTDTSLDNILQMCANSSITGNNMTLAYLGITDATIYPTSRIEALPHYEDFTTAGWTIS